MRVLPWALGMGLIVALALPGAAVAAPLPPPPTTPGVQYGLLVSQLPACVGSVSGVNNAPPTGGWDQRQAISFHMGKEPTSSNASKVVIEQAITLYEPCFRSNASGAGRIGIGHVVENLGWETGGTDERAQLWWRPVSLKCSNTQGWGSPIDVVQPFNLGQPLGADTMTTPRQMNASSLFQGVCNVVQELSINVCIPTNNVGTADFRTNPSALCEKFTWKYADAYTGNEYDDLTGDEFICSSNFITDSGVFHPDCAPYQDPGTYDGTDFDTVCANGPEISIDFASNWTFPVRWLGHYGKCMFFPINGWDRNGDIPEAIEGGALGEIGEIPDTITAAYTFAPACGQLGNTVEGVLEGFAIDTCAMSWANPVRDVIGIGILGLVGWYGISFLFSTVAGVFSKGEHKAPGAEATS